MGVRKGRGRKVVGRQWALLAAGLALLAWARPAGAQTATPTPAIEIDLGRFILLGPSELEAEINGFAQQHGPALDQAYTQLEKLYGVSLPLPINVRVYSDWPEFVSFNTALAPPIASPYHTRLGTREIAFIGPLPAGLLRSDAGLSMFQHELNGLFLESLSGGNVPAGLALGINQYVETPGEQTEAAIERLRAVVPAGRASLLPWPDLLERSAPQVDRELANAQALSVAAFLVDRYGFEALLAVVKGLAEGHSYRSAMAGIYGQPLERLEAEWWNYLPGYLDGGWRHSALYHYNLEPYEAALDAGAYAQAAAALDELLPFLELTGQSGAHARAQTLREEARQGLAARELTARLGQALQAGQYEEALTLALDAQAAYAAIGDAANASAAGAHADLIRQILSLRAELEAVQARAPTALPEATEDDLLALLPKFRALGDAEGERVAIDTLNALYGEQASQVARRREASRQIIYIAAALALAVLALESARALMLRQRRQPRIL